MKEAHVNENVEIVVLPSATRAIYAARDTQRISQAVKKHLLLTSMEPYHKVQVAVRHRPDGTPKAVDAYLLRAYTYTAEVVRLVVDARFNVRSVERGFAGEDEEPAPRGAPAARKARPLRADLVFGTPVPEIPTAKAAVEYACKVATAAGFKVVKLLGASANVANYQAALTGKVRAFGSVGHGYTGGIVLADGNLTSAWFAGLQRQALGRAVVYFNSCQVFNPPLQPAIMAAGARTFVGGKVNLLIGPSEEVFKCFWTGSLKTKAAMGTTLTQCEKAKYPTRGAHGISGDLKKF